MAIYFGNDKIKDIYYGSDRIKEVYYGSELVYTDPRGYWVHKDTGVKTYFELDDSSVSIRNGAMSYASWKNNCSEVKLPSGVTSLTNNCFMDSSLTSIILPESLTSIDTYTFYRCYSLTSINIPEGVTSIRGYSFYKCTALTSVTIPESVTILESSCFEGCTSLTSITIPEGVTSIGSYCFQYCSSLTLVTVHPATPPTLGGNAFANTPISLSIKVPSPSVNAYKTATNWNQYANRISGIQDGYWVHKSSGIKTYFWLDADFITEGGVVIPPSWRTNCSEVEFPLGVTVLGAGCFYNCNALTSITIPESVTSIGQDCFHMCTSLTLAIVLPAIPPSIGYGSFDDAHTSFNIKVNSPYVNAYKTATNWSAYAAKITSI